MTIRHTLEGEQNRTFTGGDIRIHFPDGVRELSLEDELEADAVEQYDPIEYVEADDSEPQPQAEAAEDTAEAEAAEAVAEAEAEAEAEDQEPDEELGEADQTGAER